MRNFVSATRPGGKVKNGGAQEASLCRCSALYPTLNPQWLRDSFCHANRAVHNPLHDDACIYLPGAVICKTDDNIPVRLRPEGFVTADVISCAAPNLSHSRKRRKRVKIKNGEYPDIPRRGALHVFHIAAANQADVLVLGTFDSGVFANYPKIGYARCCRDNEKRFCKPVAGAHSHAEYGENYALTFNAGQAARAAYSEARNSRIEQLTAERLNALHSGEQIAISIYGRRVRPVPRRLRREGMVR